MATYLELFGLASNSDLQDRCTVAIVKAAQAKLSGTPSANEAAWAASVIASPRAAGVRVLNVVLAANSASTTTQITGATDAAIQSNVDAVIDALVVAHAGGV